MMNEYQRIMAMLSLIAVKVGVTPEESREAIIACDKAVEELQRTRLFGSEGRKQ